MGFRRKLTAEEREAFDATLAEARSQATYEKRGDREFLVVRLPDKYGSRGPAGGLKDVDISDESE